MTFLIVILTCIIFAVRATSDLTNVDLTKFQYFKYPKTTQKPLFIKYHGQVYAIRKIPDPPSKFEIIISHWKAIVKYLKGIAFGNPEQKIKSELLIDPESGDKLSRSFQLKHGKFGEKLVHLLGAGASKHELIAKGAIDS